MPGKEKIDGKFIDNIILTHMGKPQNHHGALQRTLYQEVEGKNRDIRREAIGRRINTLLRDKKIFIIRQMNGEPLFGLVIE